MNIKAGMPINSRKTSGGLAAWSIMAVDRPLDTMSKSNIKTNVMGNIKPRDPKSQPLSFGVRYRHDPKALRRADFAREKRRPHCVEEAKRLLLAREKSRAYYPDITPLLWHQKQEKDGKLIKVGRKRRTEYLEGGINILLLWVLHSLRLDNMICGRWLDHLVCDEETGFYQRAFVYYDYEYFAKKTGLTLNRVKRHMRTLQTIGILKVNKINKSYDQGPNGLVIRHDKTIIRVSDELFTMLGLRDKYLENSAKVRDKEAAKDARLLRKRQKLELRGAPYAPFKSMSKVQHDKQMALEQINYHKKEGANKSTLLSSLKEKLVDNNLPYNPARPNSERRTVNNKVREHSVYNPDPVADDKLESASSAYSAYTPVNDVNILMAAHELLKDGIAKTMREAVELVKDRLEAKKIYLEKASPPH